MFKKLKFVTVFLMAAWLGGTNVLLAQSRVWNGETNNGGNSEGYKLVPNASGKIPIANTITLTGNLTLTLVDDVPCSIRNNSGGNLFVVPNGCRLTIIGKEGGHKVELNGQASFTNADNPTAFQQQLETTTGRGFNSNTKNSGALIKCAGALVLTDVVVTNNYNSATGMYNDAGGIHIYNAEGTAQNVTLTRVTIQRCHSSSTGGAMRIHGGKLGNVKMMNCEIKQCSNWTGTTVDGGTIRTNGGCSATFVMDGCTVHNNYSNGNGGAFWWNAYGDGGTATIKNSTFYNNYSRNDGGALFNTGAGFSVQGCTIYNNTARNDGGGIYCRNYIRTGNGDGNVTLDANCNIYNNTAGQHGGGVGLGLMAVEEEFTPVNLTMTLNFNGAKVYSNTAKYGGGISMVRTEDLPVQYQAYFNLTGGYIYNNTASTQGGGAYLTGGIHNTMTGGFIGKDAVGTIYPNIAPNGGGFYIAGGESMINGTECIGNTATTGSGGGYFVTGGNTTLSSGSVIGNTANNYGGGFYMNGGALTLSGGNIGANGFPNHAVNGGGVYANGGEVNISNGYIQYNTATTMGGGVYANGGTFTISNTSDFAGGILSNEAVNGGGGYVNGGTLEITGGNIDDNQASANGGGFYVNGGTLNLYGGTIGQTHGNDAVRNGGGFYLKGGVANIKKATGSSTSATVQYNTAANGAGIYMEGTSSSSKAVANFEDGTIQNNVASTNGGGIYLANYSELKMSGASTITGNHVPATGKGGGVFKQGGTNTLLWVSGTSLQIVDNYAGTDASRSNAYLNSYNDYITVDPVNGIGSTDPEHPELATNIKIGVSVNVNGIQDLPTPVIYSEAVDKVNDVFYMLKNPNSNNGVFDDASRYVAVYQSGPDPFNDNEIFFIATWSSTVDEVSEDFFHEGDLSVNISTAEELAWFMVLVNGLNGEVEHPNLNASLTTNVNLETAFWTPIGEWDHNDETASIEPYQGTFDGAGHTVSIVSTCGIIGYYNYGLFGRTKNATIKNLVLADCNIVSGETVRMGCLVAEMDGGLVENCSVSGTLNPSGSETIENNIHSCVVGGLIGETKGNAVIRNCIATENINATCKEGVIYPGMQAYTAGGLLGMTSAGTVVENCFANPQIHHDGKGGNNTSLTDYSRYVGGLIGENYGKVRNCYVRLERASELAGVPNPADANVPGKVSKFGMFAGLNAAGATVEHCFYPNEDLRHANIRNYGAELYYMDSQQGTSSNHGQYDAVTRPYTYTSYLVDNQVDGGSKEATTLLSYLNAWVEDANDARTDDADYSHWMRTEGSDVNADYPVLSYDNLIGTLNYTTVGSKDGIRLEYSNRFNEIYGRFAAETEKEGSLFVYRTPWTGTIASPADEVIGNGVTVNNSGTDIKVFVEDGVALLQDAGSTLVNTYTCHEFNDASRSWHHISSSLDSDSPIGFNYTQNAAYNEESNPCGASVATGNYASFLPAGIPMADLDLYCFYEKEYHWINFKRNSSSHWHMNDKHQNIAYTNETNLVAGKGYLASFAGRTFVQAGGELANGEIKIGVTAQAGSLNASVSPAIPADEGTELKGYNLLGNPYQSYLDIEAFMTKNSSLLVNTGKSGIDVPSYAIYDSEANAYVQGMASKPSLGSRAASDQIKMHEGFFIYTANDGDATFTNDMRCTPLTPASEKSSEQPAYPLVNLMVTNESGESDIAVAEFGRPQTEGAAKMKQIGADGKIYFHYADDDYALLYLNEDTDQLPVRFDAIENGTYTMTWSTANATFSYLHLVDNMTGIDVDMLTSDAYTFTASSSDYKSRFKLMFAYTGVEENEAASTSSASFAFMHDDALTVNGEGMLEVIDMSGRTIVSRRLTDAQNTVSLPQAAQGVYVLRLTNDNQSKVQKIVIE